MKEIQLTQGKTTIVDDSDYEYLMQWKWCAAKSPVTWYAVSKIKGRMHKLLTGAERTDHKDRNGLNNQRENLRPATGSTVMELIKSYDHDAYVIWEASGMPIPIDWF